MKGSMFHWAALAAFVAAAPAAALGATSVAPVNLAEAMDWVAADTYFPVASYPSAPAQPPGAPWPVWPVLRLDVGNNLVPLGVYQLLIGARPGIYDWSQYSDPAMMFGQPWYPMTYDFGANPPAYVPQWTNGDGTLDWRTELLPVAATPLGPLVDLSDGVSGQLVPLLLPSSFNGYAHVYRFETMGPFVACGGGCALDSVPIGVGETFSFYVTGGLASPLVYFDPADYLPDGSLRGTFNGGVLLIPEPATLWMMLLGAGLLATRARRRG
jgi:PEP-CTERM motif